jgi:transposase-like protein
MPKLPSSLLDATRYFADGQRCIDVVASLRWTNGIPVCPFCGTGEGDRKHYWFATQRRWKCYSCRKQFSVKINTVFEDSPVALDKWLVALWMLCNCKNGVSSHEISRDLKVTQKTAWFMLHRLRFALQNQSIMRMGQDGGPTEADETFVGGKPRNMHLRKRKLAKNGGFHTIKPAVFGMLDRETRQVRAKVIPNVSRETLQKEILDQVVPGSKVYTDGWKGYHGLADEFVHETVNHLQEYVRGEIHTQGIENFWSLLKRGLSGTYVAVEPFHLSRYVDEQMFRFNNRATKDNPLTDADRFVLAVSQIAGKRLTWAELTGKVPPSL